MLTETAKICEKAFNTQEGYETLVSCANSEDVDGLIWEASQKGVSITEEDAWSLIECYQTQGSAY